MTHINTKRTVCDLSIATEAGSRTESGLKCSREGAARARDGGRARACEDEDAPPENGLPVDFGSGASGVGHGQLVGQLWQRS